MPDRVRPALYELTMTRIREFLREPEALFWVFAFPVLMAIALGIAFRTKKPTDVVAGVLDEAAPAADAAAAAGASADPAWIAQALDEAGGVKVRRLTAAQAEVELRNGRIAVLVVPGSPPAYRFDPNRPESGLARFTVDDLLQRAAGREDAWTAEVQEVTVAGSRYIDWLLPGLIGMNIMGTGLWSIGFSVVVARQRKLLKRLISTPMPRAHYLLSHLLARLGFLVMEVVVILVFGWLAFGVTSRGPLALVLALCLLGSLTFAGLGLLVASRAKTIEGVSGLMNVVMLPMWLLSGVFFSSSNFPDAAQPFIQALPLTALNDALRGVMIEGVAFPAIGHEAAILGVWGAVSFALALRMFRWR